MKYEVKSPGSCGEFLQGYGEGHSFMVTCPINRYAHARSEYGKTGTGLSPKAEEAVRRTLNYLGEPSATVEVILESFIPVGKGMASSTADISAVTQATALACGRMLSNEEIADIALQIEPSDATFCEGIVQFDYREGRWLRYLGTCPDMRILVYDCGGKIDTMTFNERNDLVDRQRKHARELREALDLFCKGLSEGDVELIGEAATISAFANQDILRKEPLGDLYKKGKELGGKGVVCAHSGTVLGVILEPRADAAAVCREINRSCRYVRYLDTVLVTNEGMTVREVI